MADLKDVHIIKQSFNKQHIHQTPRGGELSDDPDVYRRDLVYNFVRSLSKTQLAEIIELENMFLLLKGEIDDLMYQKNIEKKGELNKADLIKIKLMKEILVDLHKLKHGDKHVNVSVGYKDIQDMMFSDRKPKEEDNNISL